MKGILACVVGVALTASALAPSAGANYGNGYGYTNGNGEVHYYSSSSVAPSGVQVVRLNSSDRVVMVQGPSTPLPPGTRVYFVHDDPGYDLSGSGDHWFLAGNGTAFQSSWRGSAVLASTGTMRGEVIPITAEYRQDWLAVMAGDRPVRTFTSPRPMVDVDQMAMAPATIVYVLNGDNGERYSNARFASNGSSYRAHHPKRKHYTHRRTSSARYSAAVKHRRHRHHRMTTASMHRRHRPAASYSYASNGYRPAQARTAVVEPAVATNVEIRRDEAGNELFQLRGDWYMKSNGEWLRSESWRGPFGRVKKGSVPREVRMSEDHPSRMDSN